MKRRIAASVIFAVLLLCGAVWARMMTVVVGGGVSAVSSCTTVEQTDVTGGSAGKFGDDTVYRRAGSITVSSPYDLCKVTVHIKKTGSPTGTITCKIYSDSSNKPGTALYTASNTVSESSITTSYQDFTFNFSSASLSSARYHISLETTLNDASNYFSMEYYSTGSEYTSSYTTSWGTGDPSAILYHIAYK